MDSHEFFDMVAMPELSELVSKHDENQTSWERFQKVLRRIAVNPNADDFRSSIIQILVNPEEADMELSDKMNEVFRYLTEWKPKDYFLESMEYRCGDDNHVVKFQNYDPER